MRHPVSTLQGDVACERSVLGGVVGGVVLPAAPQDAGPCAAEDARGVRVVAAAVDRALVDVVGPGVPVAGGGGGRAGAGSWGVFRGPAGGDGAGVCGVGVCGG